MSAKLTITHVRIDAPQESLRVDITFKAEVELAKGQGKKRKLQGNETHYFVPNLPQGEERRCIHNLPASWKADITALLAQLEGTITDYLS